MYANEIRAFKAPVAGFFLKKSNSYIVAPSWILFVSYVSLSANIMLSMEMGVKWIKRCLTMSKRSNAWAIRDALHGIQVTRISETVSAVAEGPPVAMVAIIWLARGFQRSFILVVIPVMIVLYLQSEKLEPLKRFLQWTHRFSVLFAVCVLWKLSVRLWSFEWVCVALMSLIVAFIAIYIKAILIILWLGTARWLLHVCCLTFSGLLCYFSLHMN